MDTLTTELLSEIALFLPIIIDVIRFYQVNRITTKCNHNDYFWMQRFYKDYPNLLNITPINPPKFLLLVDPTYMDLYKLIFLTGISKHLSTCTCTCMGVGPCSVTCPCGNIGECLTTKKCDCANPELAIRFVKPKPPYNIVDWRHVLITQVGCKPHYSLANDITLSKESNYWKIVNHPRDTKSMRELMDQDLNSNNYIQDNPDTLRIFFERCLSDGYMRVNENKIIVSMYDNLSKQGYISKILDYFYVEYY